MTSEDHAREKPWLALYTSPSRLQQSELLWANRTVIAASSAAVASVVAGFPFDSLKTRMQTHRYDSLLDCMKKTYAEEGARGFFRGMIPPLLTVSAIKSVSFSIYENTKQKLRQQGMQGHTLPSLAGLAMLSGGTSGAFVAMLSCPLELIKIQRQLELVIAKQQSPLAKVKPAAELTSWHAARHIIRSKGIIGLWSGLGCHAARDTLGTSIYFGGYETSKRLLGGTDPANTSPLVHFLAGGLSGMFSWLIVFPIDLVKSVTQKDVCLPESRFKNAWHCATHIIRHRGVRGLYRGLNVTLIRAFPIHSLNFLVYEQVLAHIPSPPPT